MSVTETLQREAEELEAKAAELLRQAAILRQTIAQLGGATLHIANQHGKLDSELDPQTRASISRQTSAARGSAGSLTKAAQDAGHSLRELAELCGFSHAYLSQLAKGDRPVSAEVAVKVRRLTKSKDLPDGWDAWPRRKSG